MRNSALDAKNFFGCSRRAHPGVSTPHSELPSAGLSQKNRLFLFGNYEGSGNPWNHQLIAVSLRKRPAGLIADAKIPALSAGCRVNPGICCMADGIPERWNSTGTFGRISGSDHRHFRTAREDYFSVKLDYVFPAGDSISAALYV